MHSDQALAAPAPEVASEPAGARDNQPAEFATDGEGPGAPRLEAAMKPSTLVSRNVTVAGHRTSCRLEPFMWDALYDICRRERITIHTLCTQINERKEPATSLTAAIRVFALAYFRAAATEEGHARASHGQGEPFHQTPFETPDAAE
ncbi:ribbon-helix-helix domain-containing protein [Skermanella sp. TT6]|nr:ribbon-helix-helix domain-containing protein [Skermanella sp. TT6]